MRLKRLGAVAAALVATASGALVVGTATASADPSDCPGLYVLAVPGTWETGGNATGMLANATNGLPGNVSTEYVSYSATAFPWEAEVYGRSKQQAVERGRAMIAGVASRCGASRIAIVGFSQGADAAGDIAAEIGTGIGVVPANRVVAVALLSDPSRSPSDVMVGPPVGGFGAGGPRVGGFGFVTPVVKSFCTPGDLYCSTDRDDFVTRFAGFLAKTSDPNPAQLWRYQQEAGAIFGDLANAGGLPLLESQVNPQANEERARKLAQFYGTRTHEDYGWATSWVHGWLSQIA